MLQLLRPFLYVWACLSFIDDISIVMKVLRLVGVSTFNRSGEDPEKICNLCDGLMENILRGSEGFEAVPCSWICLKTKRCTNMCRKIQDVFQESYDFPCVAAGYCKDEDGISNFELLYNDIDCKKGPLYSCEPKKFCRRRRKGFRFTCDLKPGVSRWIHMQKSAAIHTSAIAAGLITQKKCDEPNAGPYCIAKPSGSGRIAEIFGTIFSLVYGGYYSIKAIESPGGDDDQQWLTFWLMFVSSMFFEQSFARVLLSKFPFYYQSKLVLILWLMLFDGATTFYRKIRRKLHNSPYFSVTFDNYSRGNAQNQLDAMVSVGSNIITGYISDLERVKSNLRGRNSSDVVSSSARSIQSNVTAWEYDCTEHGNNGIVQTEMDAEEKLFYVSKFILSSKGMWQMENNLNSSTISLLLERAAPIVSFQPKFLHIYLVGTKSGFEGRLPIMDSNAYVKFILLDTKCCKTSSTKSSIAYHTRDPLWNESLEIAINDGALQSDGKYRNNFSHSHKLLLVEAWDADIGKWGTALEIYRVLFIATAMGLTIGYIMGILDFISYKKITHEQWQWKMCITAFVVYVILGFFLSYTMSVVLRADDEFIGSSIFPLEILTDQREHCILFNLFETAPTICTLGKENDRRGIIRVKLSLSEQ